MKYTKEITKKKYQKTSQTKVKKSKKKIENNNQYKLKVKNMRRTKNMEEVLVMYLYTQKNNTKQIIDDYHQMIKEIFEKIQREEKNIQEIEKLINSLDRPDIIN